jgi:DNA-binding NtrC family response regulator
MSVARQFRIRTRHALLAEDDAMLRKVLHERLVAWGLAVIEASNRSQLADLIALIRSGTDVGIDVIVSELQMLGMGSQEIRSQLRAGCGTTPIIVLSAMSDVDLACDAARAGATVFGKPFDLDDLGTAVVNAVST